jgi:hypothetical protein
MFLAMLFPHLLVVSLLSCHMCWINLCLLPAPIQAGQGTAYTLRLLHSGRSGYWLHITAHPFRQVRVLHTHYSSANQAGQGIAYTLRLLHPGRSGYCIHITAPPLRQVRVLHTLYGSSTHSGQGIAYTLQLLNLGRSGYCIHITAPPLTQVRVLHTHYGSSTQAGQGTAYILWLLHSGRSWYCPPGFHTVGEGDGEIYPQHKFDMGGYPPPPINLSFLEICFLVLKI